MSEDLVDKLFKEAGEQVEAQHLHAVEELKSKVERAKAATLKKVSS